MSILRLVNTHLISVTYHPYRTAMVYDRFLEMDRNSDEAREFEDLLVKAAGKDTGDNHTAYTLELNCFGKRENPKLYVMCSDSKISIGTQIEFRNW